MLDMAVFVCLWRRLSLCAPRESETAAKNEQITVGNFPNRKKSFGDFIFLIQRA